MKRIAHLSLCVILLATHAATALAEPTPDAANAVLLSVAPEKMQPWCAPAGPEGKPWAMLHPKEYRDWLESVHGRAYFSGNRDAPDCLGCHDDPADGKIRTPEFRLEIPSRCARCHDDEQLTKKHDLASDVYESYRADYHGMTIEYYRRHDPSRWRFEAVCSDCHRSHAIYRADDPRSSFASANLLATCQRCHPKAEGSFTLITTGHFRTDRKVSPLAYYIKVFYQILIPVIIGLMLAYIALDLFSRLRRKLAGKQR